MSNQLVIDIVGRVKAVLVTERKFLKSGQVHDAVSLSGEKLEAVQAFESMLGELPPIRLSASDRRGVKEIVEMARENAIIFDAVRNGLRSITTRLENLDGSSSVGTYNRYGSMTSFKGATGYYAKKV